MCIIIDANQAASVFKTPFSGQFAPIFRWINDKNGRLVYGGKLKDELGKIDRARQLIAEWKRAGRAIEIASDELGIEERNVDALDICRSNDQHIIALARKS